MRKAMYEMSKLQEEKLLLEIKDNKTKKDVEHICKNYRVVIESLFTKQENNDKKQ